MSDLSAAVLLLPVRRGARDCALGSPAGTAPWSCHTVLGRGALIATVVSFGETRESASAQPATAVPILAAPFAKA